MILSKGNVKWIIREGEDGLYLINENSGDVYKIVLEEVKDENIVKSIKKLTKPDMNNLSIRGEVEIIVKDKTGKIKFYKKKNVITNVGKSRVAGLINGYYTTPFKYIAIGTGTTSPSETDTALESEVARKEGSTSLTTVNVTNDTAVVEATFSSADGLSGTQTISEYGLFDSASGGNMLARQVQSVTVNWDAGDTLTVRWKITVS